MTHAEKCPVCNGVGKIEECNPYNYGNFTGLPLKNIKICHGCNGVGWVTVKDMISGDNPLNNSNLDDSMKVGDVRITNG